MVPHACLCGVRLPFLGVRCSLADSESWENAAGLLGVPRACPRRRVLQCAARASSVTAVSACGTFVFSRRHEGRDQVQTLRGMSSGAVWFVRSDPDARRVCVSWQ